MRRQSGSGTEAGAVGGMSVGEAAARLGVASSTLRTWERRYGLASSGRSAGGHRRYTEPDLAVLQRMHTLTLEGQTPARAALLALQRPSSADRNGGPGDPVTASAGPGGRVLAVPGAGPRAQGLARAASRLDVDGAAAIIEAALRDDGVITTYDTLVRPVLAAAGEAWARTGTGVEIEHLFSEATVEAMRHHRRSVRSQVTAGPPVLLACSPRDHHVIPLHVLAAALAERGVPSRTLGPRVPGPALAAAVSRTGARAVFVWAQVPSRGLGDLLAVIPVRRPVVRVVVGGPGWVDEPGVAGARAAATLAEAVALLA